MWPSPFSDLRISDPSTSICTMPDQVGCVRPLTCARDEIVCCWGRLFVHRSHGGGPSGSIFGDPNLLQWRGAEDWFCKRACGVGCVEVGAISSKAPCQTLDVLRANKRENLFGFVCKGDNADHVLLPGTGAKGDTECVQCVDLAMEVRKELFVGGFPNELRPVRRPRGTDRWGPTALVCVIYDFDAG